MLTRYAARAGAAALAASTVLTVVAPAPAEPAVRQADGWSRPRPLETRDGVSATAPTYASNASGRTVVAWLASEVVAPAPLPGEDPVVRTDVRVRTIGATGRLGRSRTVYSSLDSVYAVKVAMDADGDLVLGWTEYREETAGSRPWVRRVPRRGAPTPPQLVWGEGSETGLDAVAVTPRGDAVVTWLQPRLSPTGATLPELMLLRRVRADGSLSPVTDLGLTGITAPTVAGKKAFWVAGVVNPVGGVGSSGGIEVVRVDTRGRVEARRTLDPGPTAARPGLESSYPRLTLDDHEDARVLWTRYDSVNGGNEIVGRVWKAGGGAGREVVIASGPYGPSSLATDPSGTSFVTWNRIDDNDFEGFGRQWDRRGRLGPVQELGRTAWEKPYTIIVHGPSAWVDDTGRGIVVWGYRVDQGDLDAPIVTRVRRIRPDGRTSRLPGLDRGPSAGGYVTPDGLAIVAFDRDGSADLVVRR
jgi:hypothetical protein